MYITWIITLVTIVVLAIGSKFPGFGKNKFNDDFLSLESMKSLRGLAAMGVILHHISQEQAFKDAEALSFFVNLGPQLVSIFFFCSGYGLLKSLDTKEDYLKGFMKKRVLLGIVLPYYVNIVLMGGFYLIVGQKFEPAQWVTNFLGLTMMNPYAWFPVVLALLYITFYLVFKNVKRREIGIFIMLFAIIAQGLLFCHIGHFAWWAGEDGWWFKGLAFAPWWKGEKITWFHGEWWVNSSIGFLVGMVFAFKEEKIVGIFKKNYELKLLLALILCEVFNIFSKTMQMGIGYYTEWQPGVGAGIADKIITYTSTIPQIISVDVVIFIVMMKYLVRNPITRFFGKYSLDTYLMNFIPINVFGFLLYGKASKTIGSKFDLNLLAYLVCVFAASVALGLGEYYLTDLIKKLILKKKKKQNEIAEQTK